MPINFQSPEAQELFELFIIAEKKTPEQQERYQNLVRYICGVEEPDLDKAAASWLSAAMRCEQIVNPSLTSLSWATDANDNQAVAAYNDWAKRWSERDGLFPLPEPNNRAICHADKADSRTDIKEYAFNEVPPLNIFVDSKPEDLREWHDKRIKDAIFPHWSEDMHVVRDVDCPEGAVYAMPKTYLDGDPLEDEQKRNMAVIENLSIEGLPLSEPKKPAEHGKLVNLSTEGLGMPPEGDQIQWAQASSSVAISPSVPQPPEAFPPMPAFDNKLQEFMYLNGLGVPQPPEAFPPMPAFDNKLQEFMYLNGLAEYTDQEAKRYSELLKDFTDMLDSEYDEPQELTLEQAVAILNEQKHDFLYCSLFEIETDANNIDAEWVINNYYKGRNVLLRTKGERGRTYVKYSEFTAIAVAEAYLRRRSEK